MNLFYSRSGLLIFLFMAQLLGATMQSRQKIGINDGWHFYKGDNVQITDPSQVQVVNLPHTWNTEDVFDDLEGYYRGKGQYLKALFAPNSWKNKKVYLFFEGANQYATLFVNNRKVGQHLGGYTAFRFDISEFLEFGRENQFRVEVDNSHDENIPPLDGDFTFFGGIYRDVFLEIVEPVHFDMDNLASDGIFITTPEISQTRASVHIRGRLTNDGDTRQKTKVKTTIFDANGKDIVTATELTTLKSV